MRKATKVWLIIATVLIIAGAGIFTAMLANNNWDFGRVNTVKYQTKTYQTAENFQDITIDTTTADITFFLADSNQAQVICYEMEKAPHAVTFSDGKLLIKGNDNRMWYDHIGINFDTPKIKVYLPQEAYGALNIDTTTGDIAIPTAFQFESIKISATTADIDIGSSTTGAITINTTTGDLTVKEITCGSLNLTATTGRTELTQIICHGDLRTKISTGKTQLTNVRCNLLDTQGTTGDVSMHNVIVNTMLTIDRSTGDVTFKNCDAEDVVIRLDTGDVTGNFLRSKTYTAESDTGKVSVPNNSTGGSCIITTNTGNIIITQ